MSICTCKAENRQRGTRRSSTCFRATWRHSTTTGWRVTWPCVTSCYTGPGSVAASTNCGWWKRTTVETLSGMSCCSCLRHMRSCSRIYKITLKLPARQLCWVFFLSACTVHVRVCLTNGFHRSRIRYLSKKSRILTNFPKLKNSYKNLLNARVGVAFRWNSLLNVYFLCYKIWKVTVTQQDEQVSI